MNSFSGCTTRKKTFFVGKPYPLMMRSALNYLVFKYVWDIIMKIDPEEMKIYRRSAQERSLKRQKELAKRRQRAQELAYQAAQILKEEFGATRVVLYGSLLHPELFHLRSDVDLAAWDVQHYFRAVARLLDLDPEIEINLVPIEDVRPSLSATIEREGVEL